MIDPSIVTVLPRVFQERQEAVAPFLDRMK